eukprot:m.240313 g.240313  ORF g.240313 m.240313 type:complete len:130 (+) comp19410_c0_seq38:272-661(+)
MCPSDLAPSPVLASLGLTAGKVSWSCGPRGVRIWSLGAPTATAVLLDLRRIKSWSNADQDPLAQTTEEFALVYLTDARKFVEIKLITHEAKYATQTLVIAANAIVKDNTVPDWYHTVPCGVLVPVLCVR